MTKIEDSTDSPVSQILMDEDMDTQKEISEFVIRALLREELENATLVPVLLLPPARFLNFVAKNSAFNNAVFTFDRCPPPEEVERIACYLLPWCLYYGAIGKSPKAVPHLLDLHGSYS